MRLQEEDKPVSGGLLVEDVRDDELEGGSSDTFSEPFTLHVGGRSSPNLEVVRTHEKIGKSLTCDNELISF